MAKCAMCGEPVSESDDKTYREVSSWVNGPKLDGPKLRRQTGRVAHEICIQNMAAGQAPDQPGLFGQEEGVNDDQDGMPL